MWRSTQSRLATFLSSLIARRLVGPQTLCRFQLKDLSIYGRVGTCCCVCGQAHRGLTVSLLLLLYSVLCTVESLSLFYLLFISQFVCTRRSHNLSYGSFMQTKYFSVLFTPEIRMRLVPSNMFKPSSMFY